MSGSQNKDNSALHLKVMSKGRKEKVKALSGMTA